MSLMRLYNLLPQGLRSAAATARGYYLDWWRYGRGTGRLVSAARERESWSRDQWHAWQAARLAEILNGAAREVPHYREIWKGRDRPSSGNGLQDLHAWPILEKEAIRRDAKSFLKDGSWPFFMYHIHTSGSTGKPLDLWQTRLNCRAWYALFEARWRQWNGVTRKTRWAMLGGQLVVPHSRELPPYWVWNHAFNQLYMSVYHLQPQAIVSYLAALEEHRVEYLWGYTSALVALARGALVTGWRAEGLRVVLTNAEPLSSDERELLEKVFQCPVRETYGMAEIVAGASECEFGSLHFWPDAGILETVPAENASDDGLIGDLVFTGLINERMPLIRYRVGDRGSRLQWDHDCGCGRKLPILSPIDGRSDDVVVTPEGRLVGRLDPVFKGAAGVKEAQIVQISLAGLEVRIVPDGKFAETSERSIRERLRQRVGNMDISISMVDNIPRTKNGKFKGVVSLVNGERRSDR